MINGKFSCKNKVSAFLHVIILFPDPYSLSLQLLKNLVFVEFPRFLLYFYRYYSFYFNIFLVLLFGFLVLL